MSQSTTGEKEYVLGTDDDELSRLGLQHQLWAEFTARGWERAGFGRGQNLIDVGCGPGYATFDLAARVGSTGSITAIDQSEKFIGHIQRQMQTRGVSNIRPTIRNVERLQLPARSFDGAYARWVFCFVKKPQAVVAGMARSLKKGGVFVIHDYFNYESVLIAPNHKIFHKFFQMVSRSWKIHGGDPDIGSRLPQILSSSGFRIRETNPILRSARPGSPLWQWPDSFFRNYVPALVEMKLLTATEAAEFRREWKKRSHDPSSVFITPPMLEIIAEKT